MFGKVVVVKLLVRVMLGRSANDYSSVNAICLLMAGVRVIEMRPLVVCMEGIAEFSAKGNRTLCDVRRAVHELSFKLSKAMPVNCRRCTFRFVCQIDHDDVVLAHVKRRTWQLKVDAQKASLDSIGNDTSTIQTGLGVPKSAIGTCAEIGSREEL